MRKTTTFIAAVLLAGAAAAQEGATTRLTGPIQKTEYPLALGDRPLTLPSLMLEGTTQFVHDRSTFGGSTSSESGIGLRAGFGVTDQLQVDALSTIFLDPSSEWSKVLTGQVMFLAYDSRDLDVAALAAVPFNFRDGADLLSQVTLGAPSRFRINPMIYVFGLRDLVGIGFGKAFGDELNVGINGTVGVGIEPVKQLSLELDTTLFHLKVTGAAEASKVIFADNIPAGLKALFAINRQFDVFAGLVVPDLKHTGDMLSFVGGLNARL